MRSKFSFLFLLLVLSNTNTRAENPSSLFGAELGGDVFELPSIDRFGYAAMRFRFIPKTPMAPFDLYSIYADNDFGVQAIYAMAKISSDKCESELKNIVRRMEKKHDVSFEKTRRKKELVFSSEDDTTLLEVSCNRYRKLREDQLRDILLVLASKERISNSPEVDPEKDSRMIGIINAKRKKRREIKLESSDDFSGGWAADCADNNSGFGIAKIRDNYYHFLLCGSTKCINLPGISSDNVEIIDAKHLKISGREYKLCTSWSEKE